ncbi:hypothetical protein [Algibacillus agarilyticus]|uniref:hypothetical protein n=1 Tax=Algibacillus agarilyticus TaxID=2234133 RepID=UPI000DD0708C|nr:hypothetical protein [Algibacillus agarilyticus]
MPKAKKLTLNQKRAKKKAKLERQKKYMWVFKNGKQVRVKRPAMIDEIPQEDWLMQNADPIWLHQHEMWHLLYAAEEQDTH